MGDNQKINWSKRYIWSLLTQGELIQREGRHPVIPGCVARCVAQDPHCVGPQSGLEQASIAIFLPPHSARSLLEFLRCPDGCPGGTSFTAPSISLIKFHQ